MTTSWIKARQTKFTAYVTVYIAVVIAILVLVNWLANRHTKALDTTANKRFSLSDQTLKIVRELKEDVRVAYFDKTDSLQPAKDLLDRYDSLSPKLTVDYIDPDKKPQAARAAGVRTYGTILVNAAGRREEAKSLNEEEVTGALIRALKGSQRTVCSVTGSGEHTFDDTGRSGYSGLKEGLERNNYKTRSISLLEKPEVPKDCSVLLVAGPRYDYVEPVVNAVKAYVEGGGAALIALDAPIKTGQETIAENAALGAVLSGWGVTLNKDLAVDTSGVGQIFGFSAAVPLVSSYGNHSVVREMRGIATAFALPRTLGLASGAEKLFETSENSFATNNLNIAGDLQLDPAKDKKGPHTLGAAGTRPGPGGSEGKAGKQGRFVVVGSSGFAANNLLGFQGNRDLTLNMFNWLSADEDLISIRPKDPENRPLSMNRGQVNLMLYTSVILIPLAIVLAGVSVWWKRR